ncbi:MAG: helix-turn-helix transcriptional regulator [Clostridia bacterium]|nr:helix-turn-helix transcriptional regulator [Clostridia bacterium]
MSIHLGSNLAELRKRNGFSQEALAEKLGISRQAVSKWERGESAPDTDTLIELASLYNVSLDELIGNKKTQNSEQKTEHKKIKVEATDKPIFPGLSKKLLIFPFPILVTAVYIFLGFAFRLWHPMWLLFLLIPAYYHFAIGARAKTKKGLLLGLPVFEAALIIFLATGLYLSAWKYAWILFVLAIGYYWVVGVYAKKQ